MKRRTLLSSLSVTAISSIIGYPMMRLAKGQSNPLVPESSSGDKLFESMEIDVQGNKVFVRRYGRGPAILMVHGFPRTSLMWRFLAPQLSATHTVICVDLRGYGRSGTPASTDDHFPYSKRAMAKELVGVMDQLGFKTFILVGHDRGGRVSYRLALDYPERVERLAIFDVIPILEAWKRTDARFAQTYWPWILLSQKSPLPESYLIGAPSAVFDNPFGHGSFGPEIRAEYVSMYRDPARVHAVCEEYRAAAAIDVEHDRIDKMASKQIECPMLHLWAEGGPLDTFYSTEGGSLGIWRQWAPQVQGQSVSGGHFFPEENPDDTATLLKKFLSIEG